MRVLPLLSSLWFQWETLRRWGGTLLGCGLLAWSQPGQARSFNPLTACSTGVVVGNGSPSTAAVSTSNGNGRLGSALASTSVRLLGPIGSSPTTTGASRCGAGSVTLTASGTPAGGSYRWYPQAVGGTAIGGASGASYTTPFLYGTTTYYASAVDGSGNESGRVPATATIQYALAPIIAAGGPTSINAGGSVALTAKPNLALRFDGGNDYVATSLVANPTTLPVTTWEAWVYPTRVNHNGQQTIFSTDDGGWDRAVNILAGTSSFAVGTGTGFTVAAPAELNAWQHVAVIYSGNTVTFYKNGVQTYTGSTSFNATSNTFNIGRNPGFGEFFQGQLDEVRVWNSPRSPGQLQATMFAPPAANAAWLVASWRFNEGSGLTTASEPGNNPGTLTNGPIYVTPGQTSILPATYTWSPGATLNTTTGAAVTATPTTSTSYTVSVTAAGGCEQTAQQLVEVTQPLNLTAVSPTRNLRNAPVGSTLTATYAAALNAATAGNMRVFSSQRGGQLNRAGGGTLTTSSNTLTFDPTTDLRPGETVSVSLPSTITGSAGEVATPHVYQFTAATSGGSGTYAPGPGSPYAAGDYTTSSAAGDLNGDGTLDLVITNQGPDNVSILLGTGGGNFTPGPGSPFHASFDPREVVLGDVNNDGILDIMALGFNGVAVLLGTGTGSFGAQTTYGAGTDPLGVAAGDMNGDGRLDLVVSNSGSNDVSMLLGTGTGSFGAATSVFANGSSMQLALGDLNGDGQLDVVTANSVGSVTVLLGTGGGSFGAPTLLPTGNEVSGVTLGDVNGDGVLDVVTNNMTYGGIDDPPSGYVSVLLGTGAGAFTAATSFAVGNGAMDVALGDVNGDGSLDVVTANFHANSASVLLGTGTGSFGPATNVACGVNPIHVTLADLNGNGSLDLVAANYNSDDVTVLLNIGVPALTALSSPYGFPGNGVVLTGTNLTGASAVSFNGLAAQAFTVNSPTQITAFVPSGATTGPITVVTPGGTSNGLAFLVPNPTITGFTPASGPVGTTITVTGQDLDGIAGALFTGSVVATTITSNTSTSVQVVVPAGAQSGPFQLGGQYGQATSPSAFTVTVPVPANLIISTGTLAAPTSVLAGTYTTITVTGTGVAQLDGAVVVNGAFTVQTGGALRTNCQPITGTGTFTLQTGATLHVCHVQGLSATGATGAVQLTGTRSFASDASYVYDGVQTQLTGPGLPATVTNLTARNPSGVALSQPVAVRRVLWVGQATGNRPAAADSSAAGMVNSPTAISAALALNGHALTLLSDATGTAMLVNSGSAQVSGPATVQRWISPASNSSLGYRHLSSPVEATTVADLTVPGAGGFVPKVNTAFNVLPHPNLPVGQMPNVFDYDETIGGVTPTFYDGYHSPATLGTALVPGRGYMVYMKPLKPDFVGELTQEDVTLTGLTRTGNFLGQDEKSGWHLLGNPFPSPLDWDLVPVPADMSASISVFKSIGASAGVFLTRANGMGSLPNGLLPLGQGFFARVTGAGPVDLTLPSAARPTSYENPIHYRQAADVRPVVALSLVQTGVGSAVADEATVYFESGATVDVDARFDGQRPGHNPGTVPTLASLTPGGAELAINGLPETALAAGTTVELLLDLPTAGTYSLTAAHVANLPAGAALLDRKLGTRTTLVSGASYAFTATQAGVTAGRFVLEVVPAGTVTGRQAAVDTTPLTLWPNPVSGGMVRVLGTSAGHSVVVLDATGRTVRTSVATTEGATVETGGLVPGVYVVRVGTRTQRLVVE